jgi:hypothetical protein
MGWKEGESLGKNNSGLQEPVSAELSPFIFPALLKVLFMVY